MRKALALAAAAALALRLVRRRRRAPAATVVVGFADGATVALEEPTPQRERLLDVARVALTR